MSILSDPIKVERLAYRKDSHSPWRWFGPAITFPFVVSPKDWYPYYRMIEALCISLRDRYDTMEDYSNNVTIFSAPSEEALNLVPLTEEPLSPLVFPLPHS